MKGLVASLLLLCLLTEAVASSSKPPVNALSKIFGKKSANGDDDDFRNPFDDDYECKAFGEVVGPGFRAIITFIYGTTLVLFNHNTPHQIHLMTMFRATGHDKLEQGVLKARQNFRDAKYAAIRRAPSLLMARRSMKKMDNRFDHHRKIKEETKKAKADGVVTEKEAKKLAKLQQKQMKILKRDMKRLMNAGTTMKLVIEALDFDEIADVAKGFCFQFLAVMSTGHSDSQLGAFISNWCLFLNLGDLIMDTNGKLKFPIAKIILRKGGFGKMKPKVEQVEATGKLVVYAISGFLVTRRRAIARRLNGALLSSACVMRGIRRFCNVMCSWDNDDDDGPWPAIGRFLEDGSGGLFMIGVAGAALVARDMVIKEELVPPELVNRTLTYIETGIEGIAAAADKIV